MTFSLPFPAFLSNLLNPARRPAPALVPGEPAPDHLRLDIGLPSEAAPPPALPLALRARGDL